MRGADVVARALAHAGTKHVFTLSGNHIMPHSITCAAASAGRTREKRHNPKGSQATSASAEP